MLKKQRFFYPHPQFTRSCPFFYYIFGQLRDSNIFFTRSCPSELSVFFIIFSDNSGTLTFLPGVVPRSCPKFAGIMLQKTCNFFSSPGVVRTVPSSTVRSFLPTAGSISARPRGFHGQLRSCPSGIIPPSLKKFCCKNSHFSTLIRNYPELSIFLLYFRTTPGLVNFSPPTTNGGSIKKDSCKKCQF